MLLVVYNEVRIEWILLCDTLQGYLFNWCYFWNVVFFNRGAVCSCHFVVRFWAQIVSLPHIEALCSQVACGRFCLSVCLLIFLWVAAFTGALLSITCRIYWDVTFLSPLKILKFFLINLAGGLSVLCWSSLQTRCWLNWFSWMICFLLHLSPLTRTHCFSLLRGALLAEVVALRRICMHLIP